MYDFGKNRELPALLIYKTSASDPGVALNFCPFCGNKLNTRYTKPAHKKAEARKQAR